MYMHFLKGGDININSISSIIKSLKKDQEEKSTGDAQSSLDWITILNPSSTSSQTQDSNAQSQSSSSVSQQEIKNIAIRTSLSYPNLNETDKGLNNELKKLQYQVDSTKEVPTKTTQSSETKEGDGQTDAGSTGSDDISSKLNEINSANDTDQDTLKGNFMTILSKIESDMDKGNMTGGNLPPGKERIRIKQIVDKLKEASKQKKRLKLYLMYLQKK